MKKPFAIATLLLAAIGTAAAQEQQADNSKTEAEAFVTRHSSLVTGGEAAWVPFAVEHDIEPGSALDFSWIAAAHAPCGVHGRVVARGDHFEFEDKPGEPVRFWGGNLCTGANFPDPEKVDDAIAHMARLGYNAVRLHHHDDGLVAQNPDAFGPSEEVVAGGAGGAVPRPLGLDPDALRRMDALVAACGRHGLYIITDIYVSRSVSWRSCGIDRDGTMSKGQFKHLVPIHDGAFSNWCAFASAWLGHTNAFTGVRLADDPALIAVALINEGNLDNGAGPEPFVSLPNWQERWSSWLAEKKSRRGAEVAETQSENEKTPGASDSSAALRETSAFADIPATIPDGNHWTRTRHVAAFSRFLTDVEADFEARARRFLREEVGLKAPISNMSAWMQPPEYQSILAGPTQDYVEMHAYCDHPTFPERQWGLPCRVGCENPVRQRTHSMDSGAMGATLKRIFGKPFCVTEMNYCGPNPHRGAGGLLFGAEAAVQDWSGVWRFDWAQSKWGLQEPGSGYCGLFDTQSDPLRTASERIAAALFLRGDLAPCADAYAVWLPPSKITETFDGESHQLNTPWPELAWRARLGTVWGEEPPDWARWVDPYPDYYKRKLPVPDDIPQRAAPVADIPQRDDIALDREAGWFTVATPRTCAVFAEGGAHEAGVLRVELLGVEGSRRGAEKAEPQRQNENLRDSAPSAPLREATPASATLWASSLDGEPLATSSRILVGMLTDLRNTGMETEHGGVGTSSLSGDSPTILVRKWGTTPYLVRAGQARVELATTDGGQAPRTPEEADTASSWTVWALSQGGRRRFQVPCERTADGRLAFTADTAADPEAATFFWELIGPRP